MKPKPLETSHHLTTPDISMTLPSVSSANSLTVVAPRLPPGIFVSIPSDAMTPHAAVWLSPLQGRFDESVEIKITPAQAPQRAKCACAQVMHSGRRRRINAG